MIVPIYMLTMWVLFNSTYAGEETAKRRGGVERRSVELHLLAGRSLDLIAGLVELQLRLGAQLLGFVLRIVDDGVRAVEFRASLERRGFGGRVSPDPGL